jgi:surface polysaccharide O-acyltransferase-like enzyme
MLGPRAPPVPSTASPSPAVAARYERHAVAQAVDAPLYLWSWDRLRVVAALDIVAHHVAGAHALYGFGLPLFLVLSVALAVSKRDVPDTGRLVGRRIRHVLVPWAFWSLALTAVRAATAVVDGESAFGWAEWPMLLYGPRIHLWFLPFVVAAGAASHLLHKWSSTQSPWAMAAAGLVGCALLTAPPQVHLPWPFDQWFFSVPAILLGFALGRAVARERNVARLRALTTGGYALFGLGCAVVALVTPNTGPYVLRFAGGLGLLVAALWLPNRGDRWIRRITPLMLGVYILHPAVYRLAVEPVLGAADLTDVRWLRVALTFPATLLVVWGMRRTWLRRVL